MIKFNKHKDTKLYLKNNIKTSTYILSLIIVKKLAQRSEIGEKEKDSNSNWELSVTNTLLIGIVSYHYGDLPLRLWFTNDSHHSCTRLAFLL